MFRFPHFFIKKYERVGRNVAVFTTFGSRTERYRKMRNEPQNLFFCRGKALFPGLFFEWLFPIILRSVWIQFSLKNKSQPANIVFESFVYKLSEREFWLQTLFVPKYIFWNRYFFFKQIVLGFMIRGAPLSQSYTRLQPGSVQEFSSGVS